MSIKRRVLNLLIKFLPDNALLPLVEHIRTLRKVLGLKGDPNKWTRKLVSTQFKSIAHRNIEHSVELPEIEFLVYYGDNMCQNHIKMWEPVFQNSGRIHANIIRFSEPWYDAALYDNTYPISAMRQIEPLLARMPNLKAIFYPANNGNNLQMIRNTDYTHVFLGHGDSGKASSANKVFRLYDEVWVAGDSHINRFDKISGNFSSIEFRKIGQPWMASFYESVIEQSDRPKTNIGYFPTWKGYYVDANYSSVDEFAWIVDSLTPYQNTNFSKFICKLHPRTTKQTLSELEDICKENNWAELLDSTLNLREALLQDLRIAVCDNSASVTETLYLDIPILLYVAPEATYTDDIATQFDFCYQFSNQEELNRLLDQLMNSGQDPLETKRGERLREIVDLDAMQRDQFSAELQRIMNSAQ